MFSIITLSNYKGVGRQNEISQNNFLIKNVKVFTGAHFIQSTDVLVVDGIITQIDKEIESELPTLDGKGKTLLPGLYNAHVHAWIPFHLENAFNYGVYGLVDLHSLNEISAELKTYELAEGFANLYASGYAATVPNGHGTQFGFPVPVIDASNNCYNFIDQQVEAGIDHIKIIYEPRASTLNLSQIDSLIRRAHVYGKKVIVHISNVQDALDVVKLGADGLAHIWRDREMTVEEMQTFQKSGAFVIPTLAVYEKVLDYKKDKGLQNQELSLAQMQRQVTLLYKTGVKILAGTDPPNFELDYGKSLHRELVLLQTGGLSIVQALQCATTNVSDVFNYTDFSIKKGAEANFMLIDDDIEKDISHSHKIIVKWVKGKIISKPD